MPEKREDSKLIKYMKILTAISLGKDRNKEIAKMLDTDKSFAAKKIKEMEEQGLIYKEGEGKETRYAVNKFNVLEFLQGKVVIKWPEELKKEKELKEKTSEKEEKLELKKAEPDEPDMK